MMMDEAQPPSSSSSEKNNVPPPDPDPPPNQPEPGSSCSSNLVRMSSPSPSQTSQPQAIRSRVHSSGTSEDNQSSSPNSSPTPHWMKWTRGLTPLLDDPQGKDLFEKYLDQEGCSAQLHFLWACKGLRYTGSDDPPKIPQLIRTIHRHFFQNTTLLGVSDTTRHDLTQAIIGGRFNDVTLFDKAEEDVHTHMEDNLYPNFLKSEIYLYAVNGEDENSINLQEQLEPPPAEVGSSSSGRKSSAGDVSSGENGGGEQKAILSAGLTIDVDLKSGSEGQSPKIPSPPLSTVPAPTVLLPNQLQTVHEDKELSVNSQQAGGQHSSKLKLSLTKEALHMTQLSRATVPVAPVGTTSKIRSRETFTSHYHAKPGTSSASAPLHPYHASYSAYNPVSRVDSEIQSMSSDAMTEDGAHSGHGGHSSARKHGAHHPQSRSRSHQQLVTSHLLHQQQHSSGGGDSRRQVVQAGLNLENRDNLPKYPAGNVRGLLRPPNREAEQNPETFAKILIDKLEAVKREREADEMMIQRMPELNDIPMARSDIPMARGAAGGSGMGEEINSNVLAAAINKLQVQDEDLPGDILDKHLSRVFSDITPNNRSPNLRSPTTGRRRGGPSIPAARMRRERDVISTFSGDSGNVHDFPSDTLPSTMTKSRSIPCEMKMQEHGDFTSAGLLGALHRGRFVRGGGLGHGESRNVPLPLKRTPSEFLDSGISVLSGATPTVISATTQPPPPLPYDRTDLRVAQWMEQSRKPTSPPTQRRSKKQVPMPHSSAPMPPTPVLEEVRRRLAKKNPPLPASVLASQSIQVPIGPLSSVSSSGNPLRHHSPPSSDESSTATNKEHSISSFVFYEDTEVPYCVKIPCKKTTNPSTCGITLAVFKEHLPKRGNYRYFFKRECEELDAKVVQEEITDDFQELPLYEGKIIANLQAPVGALTMSASASVSDKF